MPNPSELARTEQPVSLTPEREAQIRQWFLAHATGLVKWGGVGELFAEIDRMRQELIWAVDERYKLQGLLEAAQTACDRLRDGIRTHRDQRNDDRCWADDLKLYALLTDGIEADTSLPDECEFLESCRRFWHQRQKPIDIYLRPEQMTIAQLQVECDRLRDALAKAEIKCNDLLEENVRLELEE